VIVRPVILGALAAEAVALTAAVVLVADFRAHTAVEHLGGVNIWGYRGPVMPRKKPNETRIAVAGGDLAFGWGVAASETAAPAIRTLVALAVDLPGQPARIVTAVNLGALGLPPEEYAPRIAHYAYLHPDVICVFADPPPRTARRAWLPATDSAVFAATGYAPMLPLVLADKGRAWHSGSVESAGAALRSVDRWLYRTAFEPARTPRLAYDAAIEHAARTALAVAGRVAIVAPPGPGTGAGADSADSNVALADMATSSFAGDRRVRFVDLDIPDLADEDLLLDGVNFSAAGHARIAQQIVPAVLALMR
jgi:hypothetical protein